jgi:hypothetical protein
MFEVPHSAPRGNPWRLAMLWMGVAVINLIVSSLIYPVLFSVIEVGISDIRLLSGVVSLITQLLLVTLQWLVLRRFFAGMRWWVPAHAVLLLLALLLEPVMTRLAGALLLSNAFTGGDSATASLALSSAANLFWTLLSGMVGWWLFRPSARRAWLWPAALLFGALAQALVMILVLAPLLESGLRGGRANLYGLINLALGLLLAAIQAAVLMQFVRDRQRSAAQPTQFHY